jgi:hypothetical protein
MATASDPEMHVNRREFFRKWSALLTRYSGTLETLPTCHAMRRLLEQGSVDQLTQFLAQPAQNA